MIASQSAINPLIDEKGDTSKVSATLDFVSWALRGGDSDEGEIALSAADG